MHGITRWILGAFLMSFCGPGSLLAADGESLAGFQSLFNGQNLDGWEVYKGIGDQWSVSHGELRTFNNLGSQTGGWLMTKESYSDLELRLEYKLSERGKQIQGGWPPG
jgi:hypothetical protein